MSSDAFSTVLPVGKLPMELLEKLLSQAPATDPRLLLGPGIGLDCAVLDVNIGDTLLVLKSDPITFATEEIGWYAVQVNANDIATTGATPRWMLATLLLPENQTTPELVEHIATQLYAACQEVGVSLIGGHTEVTYNLDRPILMGTMIGEVSRQALITPRGARPGDRLLLTKGVPIEATAILGREFSDRLSSHAHEYGLNATELEQAQGFLRKPGISVLRDAQLAIQAGQVHAMHDPTEGGLLAALWELAQASGHSLWMNADLVPIPPLSARICRLLGLDPLAAIASGALLLAAPAGEAKKIRSTLAAEGIPCAEIGEVLEKSARPCAYQQTEQGLQPLPCPARDEIARLYEETAPEKAV